MKIILDAYQFTPNITGTDRMARNFLAELQELDPKNSYTVITSDLPYIGSVIHAANFKIIKPPKILTLMPVARRYALWAWRKGLYIWLRNQKTDVLYSFQNMRLPQKRIAKRQIVSNLDLIPLVFDDYAATIKGGRTRIEQDYRRVANDADAFMSISQYSADELHTLLQVPKKKITVIPLAADESLAASNAQSLKLPKTFVFTVGGSEPRKNVATIVAAHTKLPKALQEKYPLYIAGGSWQGQSLKPLQKSPFIHTLGYVSDEQLAELYQRSSLFVFASTYEGFGFTILEAMSAGTPVLCSRTSSLNEVAGSAAETFDLNNQDQLLSKLETLLSQPKLQDSFAKKGTEQAKQFSWKKSAQKLLGLFG